MSDKYDEQIAEFRALYERDRHHFHYELFDAWSYPHDSQLGLLFRYVTPTGKAALPEPQEGINNKIFCGCLTQVKADTRPAFTKELELAIKADKRLPASVDGITLEDLEVFAEWQRKLDAMFPGR